MEPHLPDEVIDKINERFRDVMGQLPQDAQMAIWAAMDLQAMDVRDSTRRSFGNALAALA